MFRDNPRHNKPRILFIHNPQYFGREQIYGDSRGDYPDNHRRFAFFCVAALNALPSIAKAPVLLHAHDWHTALAPVYLRAYDGAPDRGFYRATSSVLTVHNAGYQGHFPTETMADLGLPWDLYNYHQMEWYGRVNLLKGGMAFADYVTTVSPAHAHELRTPAGGFGLHDAFISLRERFVTWHESRGVQTIKVAFTVLFRVMVTVQVFPLMLSHPVQFVNVRPLPGVAVNVTGVPLA